WAHDGGVDLKSKLPEVIDGISKKNNKINISGEYIDKAWNMMNIVSKEIGNSVTLRLKERF
ncbi:hypothetical protein, partial [Oleiphilus sp. HI0128]